MSVHAIAEKRELRLWMCIFLEVDPRTQSVPRSPALRYEFALDMQSSKMVVLPRLSSNGASLARFHKLMMDVYWALMPFARFRLPLEKI